MISLVHKAVGYFVREVGDNSSKFELDRPRLEDFIPVTHSQIETQNFEGIVTSVHGSSIIINNDIYCDASKHPVGEKICLNDRVRGEAQRTNKYEAWQVVKLHLFLEEWDADSKEQLDSLQSYQKSGNLDDECTAEYVNGAFREEIQCRETEFGIPGTLKQDLLSSVMKVSQSELSTKSVEDSMNIPQVQQPLLGKVTGIFGDTATLNEDVSFRLSSTSYDWEILEGDWIICNIDGTSPVQADGNSELKGLIKVSSFKPLRKKRVRGEVTHYYPSHCIINQDIYCTRIVAEVASVRAGDLVTVEVIESHQGKFCWRAVAITLDVMSSTTQELQTSAVMKHMVELPISDVSVREKKIRSLLEDKENIVISQSLRFPVVTLGSQVYTGAFIKNNGLEARSLKRVYFVCTSNDCQFSLVCCSAGGLVDGTPVTIEANMVVNVQFECTGKLLGLVKQLCIFDFGNFHIGRYASAITEDHHMTCLAPVTPYTPHLRLRKTAQFQPKDRKIILGEKPFRPPAFLPVSLPVAPIPQKLWQALDGGEDILNLFPSLSEPLNRENHKEKLTVLLHLEEIKMIQQMRQFDMMTTSFETRGEYLSLTVPGLAEKRPSLMIGDTVIASNPCDSCDVEFEGYIHEVLNTQILLKFHPSFHNEYHGEDFAVQFNFNRTPLRRCHFALDFSMKQLGPDILFPLKLKIQLPQVCYIDPEVPIPTKRMKRAQDGVYITRDHINESKCTRTGRIMEVPVGGRPKTINRPSKGRSQIIQSVARNSLANMKIDVPEDNLAGNMEILEDVDEDLNHALNELDSFVIKADIEDSIPESCQREKFQNSVEDKLTGPDVQENCIHEKSCLNENSQNVMENQLTEQDHVLTEEISSVDFATDKKIRDVDMGSSCHEILSQIHEQEITLPRIPVVTRLFGVPSSGSSSNSSICCSDDESKSRTGIENRILQFSKAGRIDRTPYKCKEINVSQAKEEAMSGEKITVSVLQAKKEICSKDCMQSTCASSADNLIETNFSKNKSFVALDDVLSGKQQHKKRRNLHGKPKLQIVAKNPLVLCRTSGPVEIHTESGISQSNNLGGKKTLFIPRSQELNIYRNLKRKTEMKDKKQTQSCASVKESGRTEESRKFYTTCDMVIEPSDVMNGKRYDSKPSANQFDEKKTLEFRESCESKQIHQNMTKLGKDSYGNQNYRADLKKEYFVPVLPIHPIRKKGMENFAHLPVLRWFNKELNLEQKLAVRRILEGTTRPLPYVIFGPPGTGKTVTLVEAALQIVTMMQHSRLLIVTPSNSASDLVMERMLTSSQLGRLDVVRLNAYQRPEQAVPEIIRPYCCNGDQLSVRVHQRVIVTTATTAGVLYTLGLHSGHFSHVLVDEAGQLTEPECLLALGLLNSMSGQIVLAGDPAQLGPVVQSTLAKRYGLQQSLLQRLCDSVIYQPQEMDDSAAWVYEPCLVTQLMRNYRSHPDIFAVSSSLFYHNSLQACADTKLRERLLAWDELPCSSCPLLFHGIVGDNLQEGDSPSWFNPAEAFQVVRYTKSLIMYGVKPQDVGIITPYRKQMEKIQKLLTTFGIQEGVKVGSVEEFQGQERCVIIISTVRSSSDFLEVDAHHSLGFVKCPKRFNVAVTRAQALLVVVGNPILLCLDYYWQEFTKFCIQNRAYRGPELHSLLSKNKD